MTAVSQLNGVTVECVGPNGTFMSTIVIVSFSGGYKVTQK